MDRLQRSRHAAPGALQQMLSLGLPLLLVVVAAGGAHAQTRPPRPVPSGGDADADAHLDIRPDGSYTFEYDTRDATRHRHTAKAGPGGSPVQGEYRERDPAAPHRDRVTQYTAGANGFRAKGPHIARRMSLSQVPIPYAPPVHPDSPNYQPSYSGYRDPNNDPSYSFGFKTSQQARREQSNNVGTVNGAYEYRDDVGELHRVQYTAGKDTGFIVHNEVPDARNSIGPLFAVAPGRPGPGPRARGRSAVRVRPDGSYDFTAAGPNMRHQEVSNAQGFRRGSYSYVDDRGVQRTVEYEAGPNIGFKVINSHKGPAPFPHVPPTYYPALYPSKGTTPRPHPGDDDLFGFPEGLNTAESGPSVKPPKKPHRPTSEESIENTSGSFGEDDDDLFLGGGGGSSGGGGVGSGGGGKKPPYGGGSGGGGSSTGGGGGSSSGAGGSGSGEDFLVNLGENYDKGPHPSYGGDDGSITHPDPLDSFGKPASGSVGPGSGELDSGGGLTHINSGDEDVYGSSPNYDDLDTNGFGKPGGGFSKPDGASGADSSASVDEEDAYFGKPGGGSGSGGGSYGKPPSHGGAGGTQPPHHGGSYGEDDLFGPTPPAFGRPGGGGGASSGGSDESSAGGGGSSSGGGGSSGGDFLSGAAAGGGPAVGAAGGGGQKHKVAFGKCCKSRRRNRKQGGVKLTPVVAASATRRDGEVRLPPVRAHVQNIDILPYGRRLPPPGAALESLGPEPARRN